MTNSRLTDPEVFEFRFPVRLDSYAIRDGSGGAGSLARRQRRRAPRPLPRADDGGDAVEQPRRRAVRHGRRLAGRARTQHRRARRRQRRDDPARRQRARCGPATCSSSRRRAAAGSAPFAERPKIDENPRPGRSFDGAFTRADPISRGRVGRSVVRRGSRRSPRPSESRIAGISPTSTRPQADWDADAAKVKSELDRVRAAARASSALRPRASSRVSTSMPTSRSASDGSACTARRSTTRTPSNAAGIELDQRAQLLDCAGRRGHVVPVAGSPRDRQEQARRLLREGSVAGGLSPHDRQHPAQGAAYPRCDERGDRRAVRADQRQRAVVDYTLLSTADLPWPKVTLSDGTQVTLDQVGVHEVPRRRRTAPTERS